MMRKTLLAIVCAVSVISCSNEPAKMPTADTTADSTNAAGGGLSKLPSPPDDISDKSDVPERDLSVYQPGVFKLPKNAVKTTRSRSSVRVKAAPQKKKTVVKKAVAKKTLAKKTATKKVVKSKRTTKPVVKKTRSKSSTKKVTSKKTKKNKSKAR